MYPSITTKFYKGFFMTRIKTEGGPPKALWSGIKMFFKDPAIPKTKDEIIADLERQVEYWKKVAEMERSERVWNEDKHPNW